MTTQPAPPPQTAPTGHRLRSLLSHAALGGALLLVAATFFLMSPPSDAGYPGAIPWSPRSWLKPLIDLMALGGAVRTVRGVEIKDFAFHLATVFGLLLLAGRSVVSAILPPARQTGRGPWFWAQLFLAAWVAFSFASMRWSDDPRLSYGQAALYALALAWAVALAWGLESRDVPRLLWGYVFIATGGALLSICYYYVRNPYHRPGFPIGNPGTLAGSILPAILIGGAVLIESIWKTRRDRKPLVWRRVLGAGATLIPLVWCFVLAGSRSATVGLVAGVLGVTFLRARRRTRLLVVIAVVVTIGIGLWYASSAKLDLVMARGATIRFRLYAWRYAADLWSKSPTLGIGAGQYPRLASGLSIGDRVLDPAAFMGELVEHAHNELFEILSEIGLLGGVTFVAGVLATLAAAGALLRVNWSSPRRWLLYGLAAGLIAILADAMFGVGLRLSGVPAVYYTLLGTLWATGRASSKLPTPPPTATTALRRMVWRRYAVAAAALVGALAAGKLAIRNWSGVRAEFAASQAMRAGRFQEARDGVVAAADLLLDPVRVIIARRHDVDAQFALTRAAYNTVRRSLSNDSQPLAPDARLAATARDAIDLCTRTSEAALRFSRNTPNFGRMQAIGAQCAEMASTLCARLGDTPNARLWQRRALRAWQSQRFLRPFDMQTLLALARYFRNFPALTGEYIGVLRDALRNGFPPQPWYDALHAGTTMERFAPTLDAMRKAVEPFDPQTDLDTLILSRKPEMCRLNAAWLALRDDPQHAAREAAIAAQLYRPLRSRFPQLYSVARAEQAGYTFQADPSDARRAVTLLRDAMAALPHIQKQKYQQMLLPYQLRLVRMLLAADQPADARRVLADILHADPHNLQAWATKLEMALAERDPARVREVLRQTAAAGLPDAQQRALREIVRQRLPDALQHR